MAPGAARAQDLSALYGVRSRTSQSGVTYASPEKGVTDTVI